MIKEIVFLQRKPGAPGNPPRQLILECDHCRATFERLYETERARQVKHFCSPTCTYAGRAPSPLHGRKTTRPCSQCGKTVTRMTSFMGGKQNIFCDRSCVSEYKKTHQDPRAIEALKRTAADPEFQAYMSVQAKERFVRDGHPWKGRKHTEESRAKIRESGVGKHSGELNGMHGRNHSEESKEKMSDGHSRNLVEGKGFVYGGNGHVTGWYTSPKGNDEQPMFYRSSWERAMMLHLDSNMNVVRYEYERVRIPYYDTENKRRYYVPDFLVTYSDSRRSLIEIKPKQFVDNEKTRLKAEAARAYCATNGVDAYDVLTGEDLRKQGIIT